ncbi:MAG: hypothetical protein JWN61_3358 [Pseudonocardiales bacterium]|nr:hypothetical protein [Pseudonocardiales bacterium]
MAYGAGGWPPPYPPPYRPPLKRSFDPRLMMSAGLNLVVGLASLCLALGLVLAGALGSFLTGSSKFGGDSTPALIILLVVGLPSVIAGAGLIAQSTFTSRTSAQPIASMAAASAVDAVVAVAAGIWAAGVFVDGPSHLGPALVIGSAFVSIGLILVSIVRHNG